MALQKQSVAIPFIQGVDTKTDPHQIGIGKFLSLQNTVFTTGGRLTKRNGFKSLTTLDAPNLNTITTFNGNLTAIGQDLFAYAMDSEQWIDKGKIYSVQLDTLSMVRSATSQNSVDVAVSSTGLACTVWDDSSGNASYEVIDSSTGQVIVPITELDTLAKLPRVFLLGNYFFITFLVDVGATTHLKYFAISIGNVNNTVGPFDLSTQVDSITAAYDGQSIDGNVYVAWNASDVGGAVRITSINSTLNQQGVKVIAPFDAVAISITGDLSSTPVIWLSFTDSSQDTWSATFTAQLDPILIPTKVLTAIDVVNLTSSATGNVNTIFYETNNTYSYSATRSDYISSITIDGSGTVGTPTIILRSVALASKSFFLDSNIYMLVAYGGAFQPTYFLIDSLGNIVAKLAYSNGGGYPSQILSNAIVNGQLVQIGYLLKDLLVSVNKSQTGAPGGVFTQTGANLATFTISNKIMQSVEIGGALHFASGFLWMYDGVKPVEHGFHVWPEDIGTTTSGVGGFLTAQQYFYQVTYEWTDSQGNIHRSAPSTNIDVDLTAGTANNSVTLNIPTLRLTYKTTPNEARIVIYRWSTAQQNYYQVTSIQSPTQNDPGVDSIAYVDTLADSSILGNPLIYTTGGVLENIGAPACNSLALFKSRLFLIDAEDTNLIWFSKQVVETTPVEMSDLLTSFVAPTTGAQGSTGPVTVLSSMDDKLIIFKQNAIYYLTGTGPDNTGANNDFTDSTFITSTIGCTNFRSVNFMPQGLMFQSDKGIWLLGRDLSSAYIGAPVEGFNAGVVTSALSIPGTNEVRFTLDTHKTALMYDYYYSQWDEFYNIPAVSSVLYQGKHTYLNKYGVILQEQADFYLDGSQPVLMKFTTGWLNMTGLQGYERAYFFYILGKFITPHKLQIEVAYDYNPSPTQTSFITPDNFSPSWGSDAQWGSSTPWGGPSNIEQWRVFLQKQKCEAFQITISEIFDPSYGTEAGAGLTLSGINLIYGGKSQYPRLAAKNSVG